MEAACSGCLASQACTSRLCSMHRREWVGPWAAYNRLRDAPAMVGLKHAVWNSASLSAGTASSGISDMLTGPNTFSFPCAVQSVTGSIRIRSHDKRILPARSIDMVP